MSQIETTTISPVRYVVTESCVAAAINAVVGGIITSLVAHPAALAHATYWQAVGQLVLPTLGPASMFVPGITSLVRGRVAKGGAPVVRFAALRFIPAGLIARTIVIGVAALAVLGTTGGLFLWLYLLAAPPTMLRIIAFMMAYGAVFGLLVAPVVVLAALGDTPRAPNPRRHATA